MTKKQWLVFIGGLVGGRFLLHFWWWLIFPVVGVFAFLHKGEIMRFVRKLRS